MYFHSMQLYSALIYISLYWGQDGSLSLYLLRIAGLLASSSEHSCHYNKKYFLCACVHYVNQTLVITGSATWPPGVRRLSQAFLKDPYHVYVRSLDLRVS